ncbi:MAG: P-loop NTPase fold protein [Gammaproteobacteria bacterium]
MNLSKALSPGRHKLFSFRQKFVKGTENLAAISEHLLVFAASLHGTPFLSAGVKALGGLSRNAIKKLSEQKPLAEQKEKIERLLGGFNRRILVVIDDIDRLETKEIIDIFRMVKSVADFPNVIYLLSFDKSLVCNIIRDIQKAEGSDYLEKIIQYDIDIPPPDGPGLLKLLGERIDPAIKAPGGKKWDTERWSELYRVYLRDILRTPRQVVRLSNAFNMGYPALAGEVDPVDFLATEVLRMFQQPLYLEIRRNANRFTELGQMEIEPEKADPPYFEKVLNLVKEDDRATIKPVLSLLFPRVSRAFGESTPSTDEIAGWRTQGRICSSYHFGRFFSYSVSPLDFSDAQIRDAIETTSNLVAFESLVVSYSSQMPGNGRSRIPEFLERFRDSVKSGLGDGHLKDILRSFIVIGDLIVREDDEDRGGLAHIGTDTRTLWILSEAMQRLSRDELFEVLRGAFKETKSVDIPLRLLFYLGREHGKYGDKKPELLRDNREPFLTRGQLTALEEITLSIIQAATRDDRLLRNANLGSILYRWRDIRGDLVEPREWVAKVTTTDEALVKFIVRMSTIAVISDFRGAREEVRVRARNIGDFLDLEETFQRVQTILSKGQMGDRERTALEAFVASYQQWKSGKSSEFE